MTGIAGLTLLNSSSLWTWTYADWTAASAEARQSVILAGPWAAACSAWLAMRVLTRRTVIAPALAKRRQGSLVVRHLAVMTLSAWLGLAAGLSASWIDAAQRAVWGGPDYLVAVTGFAVMTAFVAWGYLLGCLLPGVVAAAVAASTGFFASVYASGTTGSVLAPTYPFGVEAGFEEPLTTSLLRIALYGAFAAALALAAMRVVRDRGSQRRARTVLAVGAPLALVVVIGTTVAGSDVQLARADTTAGRTCSEAGSTQVCVHPARATMLPALTEVVADTRAAVGRSFDLRIVADSTLWFAPAAERANLALQSQDRGGWRSSAAADLALIVTGADSCSSQDEVPNPDDPAVVAEAVAAWIVNETGDARPTVTSRAAQGLFDELRSRSPEDVRHRLVTALPAIRSCTGGAASLIG